jgi:hypothetical protein
MTRLSDLERVKRDRLKYIQELEKRGFCAWCGSRLSNQTGILSFCGVSNFEDLSRTIDEMVREEARKKLPPKKRRMKKRKKTNKKGEM